MTWNISFIPSKAFLNNYVNESKKLYLSRLIIFLVPSA